MGQAPPPARATVRHLPDGYNQPRPLPPTSASAPNGRSAAAAPAAPDIHAPGWLAALSGRTITLEFGLYALIFVAAVLTRFWDLGSRALHHDESLHTYFSWMLATGQDYVHNPLMHGPFLFHFNALVYLIFGASDVSSRATAALFGVILVMLPVLLRGERQLGRWGALFASTLILLSPSLLYQSRYLRHDIFTLVGTLLLFIAIVRYVDRPARGWLITVGATLGFLITNHEIVFGIATIFLGVVAGALLWGPLRRLIPLVTISGAAALALIAIVPERTRPLPTIPWQTGSREAQQAFYNDLLTHPLTILLVILAVVIIAAAAIVLRWRRDPAMSWEDRIFGSPAPGSVAAATREVWRDHIGISWAFIAGLAIFALLFTTLFTNLYGLASGTIATNGTLLYWMGQHDVQRGEQPWFYYLLLFPQYEFLGLVFGLIATILIGWRALMVGLGRVAPGPRFFCDIFLAIWFGSILLALSWAGEKMPWLVTHITLPVLLLAASLLGKLVEAWRPLTTVDGRAVRASGWGAPQWVLTATLLALAAWWFLVAAPLTFGEFIPATGAGGWERVPTAWASERWWLLAVPPLAGLVALAIAWVRRGARLTAQAALVAVVTLLALAQIHASWRLVYQEGDIPKDMLVYTQTSPDVRRMVDELTLLSALTTGGRDLEIWYDDNNGTTWPMQWYLRDFPNRHIYGGTLAGPPDNAPIVLVGGDNLSSVEPFLEGYTAQKYVLRWWFPEDPIYRGFAIAPELPPGRSAWRSSQDPHGPREIVASIGESLSHLLTIEGQQGLYRLVMYRDLPVRIDSYKYTLFIRNDLLPIYNQIRY